MFGDAALMEDDYGAHGVEQYWRLWADSGLKMFISYGSRSLQNLKEVQFSFVTTSPLR